MAQSFLNKQRFLVIVLFYCMSIISCEQPWSEERKQKFEKECLESKSFQNLDFIFYGYTPSEMDSIVIKEISYPKLDTIPFVLYPHNAGRGKDNYYFGSLEKEIFKNYTYMVFIDGIPVHVIGNFKTAMKGTPSMTAENYQCNLNEYELNGNIVVGSGIKLEK